MMRWLCWLGLHLLVEEGGGMMGDALKCLCCGRDKYPEVFGCYLFKRSKT